jgi:hypothetical protein
MIQHAIKPKQAFWGINWLYLSGKEFGDYLDKGS